MSHDKPQPGKIYALTGGIGDKAISNGHSWSQSEVKKGFDSHKRWGNSAVKGMGVNSPAMMEARTKLNPWRSNNKDSLEHAKKMSAYRKMDNNPDRKDLVKPYEKAIEKAAGKKGYKYNK